MKNALKNIVVLMIAACAGNAFADVTSSFGVNFMRADSGEEVPTSTSFGFEKGEYLAPANWVNTIGSAEEVTVGESRYNVAWQAHGTWNSGTGKSSDIQKLLYGYLDDQLVIGNGRVTITVSGLPTGVKYAVALILSGDGTKADGNSLFAPAVINGTTYSYKTVDGDPTLVQGAEAEDAVTWGSRMATTAQDGALTEGTNVMFVDGLSGEKLTITRSAVSDGESRFTVAGIQIWITDEKAPGIVSSTPFEWGFSNVVFTAEETMEYVLAYTNTASAHTFTVPNGVYSLQYLVVAGGGGGGSFNSGGGGAGGMLEGSGVSVAPGDQISIVVGAGGSGSPSNSASGGNGENSFIIFSSNAPITAYGGGGGGGAKKAGSDGGSGGGGGYARGMGTTMLGGAGVEGQGNAGGQNSVTSGNSPGAGGGGAGGVGTSVGHYSTRGHGGIGKASSITGESVFYAGGGGGGGYSYNDSHGTGGEGGGGNGGYATSGSSADHHAATPGVDGKGGGGGGAAINFSALLGARGGSGIVVIRYAVSDASRGIVVSSAGGSYGSPNPGYGSYETIDDVLQCTCDEYVQIEEGVRVYCTGYKLYNSAGAVVASSSDRNVTLDSSAAGGKLEWQWELRYALTLSSNEDGSVDKDFEGYYGPGTNVTIEAKANTNCSFDKWIIDGVESADESNPLEVTFSDAPISVEAVFMAHGITVNYGELAGEDRQDVKNYDMNNVGTSYVLEAPKYITVISNALRKCCIGYTITPLPDGEESEVYGVTYDDAGEKAQCSVEYSAPVKLVWKWTNEYYVATVATGRGLLKEDKSRWCRTSEVVSGIEIASTENFLGWGGFGTTAEERSGTSVSVTVAEAPITVTAYFTETDKDNLVLNGDFELNSSESKDGGIITSCNRLTAGTWNIDCQAGNSTFGSGLLCTDRTSAANLGAYVYPGISAAVYSTADNLSKTGAVSCVVYITHAGLYDFSYVSKPGDNDYSMRGNKWNAKVELVNNKNRYISVYETQMESVAYTTIGYSLNTAEVEIRKAGVYRLIFSIPPDTIIRYNNKANALFGFDNVSLKLKKKRSGFSVSIR